MSILWMIGDQYYAVVFWKNGTNIFQPCCGFHSSANKQAIWKAQLIIC